MIANNTNFKVVVVAVIYNEFTQIVRLRKCYFFSEDNTPVSFIRGAFRFPEDSHLPEDWDPTVDSPVCWYRLDLRRLEHREQLYITTHLAPYLVSEPSNHIPEIAAYH